MTRTNEQDERELLQLNNDLLASIAAHDWTTYERLCAPNLTAFEPEARGQLVEGLAFHKFYFDLPNSGGPRHTTVCAPRVRLMGDAAIVTYLRLTQRLDAAGRPSTSAIEETRIWQRVDGRWRHVHFHRSAPQ